MTGRRLLATGPHRGAIERTLANGVIEAARQARVSSAHFNFLEEDTWRSLGAQALLLREDQQFHWFNRGYSSRSRIS